MWRGSGRAELALDLFVCRTLKCAATGCSPTLTDAPLFLAVFRKGAQASSSHVETAVRACVLLGAMHHRPKLERVDVPC